MSTKKPQLARVMRGDRFIGYAIAVDGALLAGQSTATISTSPTEVPTITSTFYITPEMDENQIQISLE